MSDPNDPVPPPERRHPHSGGRPAHAAGASRFDAVPRMENVRVTAPTWPGGRRWKRRVHGW